MVPFNTRPLMFGFRKFIVVQYMPSFTRPCKRGPSCFIGISNGRQKTDKHSVIHCLLRHIIILLLYIPPTESRNIGEKKKNTKQLFSGKRPYYGHTISPLPRTVIYYCTTRKVKDGRRATLYNIVLRIIRIL